MGGLIELTDPASLGVSGQVEETGLTFTENAVLKATGYRDMTGLATLADDSGLVVDALAGRPRVRSARYAGEHATDEENLSLLLREMTGVPKERRAARFECVVAVAMPGRDVVTFSGEVSGTITEGPLGHRGFGYDPVFALPDSGSPHGGLTMAQLSPSDKSALSHRGHAARKAAEWLYSKVLADHTYN